MANDNGVPAGAPERKSARVAVPQRVRFEVFKRDRFTCQYCGRNAPDVVLQCDHIQPVAGGGTNDPLNLVTSCKECNGGKGAIPLSDSAALDKQHAMLAGLEERRQQLEMLLAWRNELQELKQDTVQAVVAHIEQHAPYFTPSEQGRADIKRWLNRFSVQEIFAGVDAAFDTYAAFEGDRMTRGSWSKAFSKIPGVIGVERQAKERPNLKRLFYIRAIIRNRTGASMEIEYLEHLISCGWSVELLEREAKQHDYITHFTRSFDDILRDDGTPYPNGRGWR